MRLMRQCVETEVGDSEAFGEPFGKCGLAMISAESGGAAEPFRSHWSLQHTLFVLKVVTVNTLTFSRR